MMTAISLQSVLSATIAKIRAQGVLPASPCAPADDRWLLCTGAWFVREALAALRSEDAAVEFEEQLHATRDKGLILRFAEQIGLPTPLVDEMIRRNDGLPASSRVPGIMAYLVGLQFAV